MPDTPYPDRRKILHIDMDAFYASVEVLDNPDLKGLPLIVGGDPAGRGVVASASYEARTFGVRSAMACSTAARLCPHAIFLPMRMARYREISQQIHAIFAQYTDLIEPISLDEAWLDVTENFPRIPSATWVAQLIKQQIADEVHLTCSAGVSYNKFLAKIASDEHKPDGLFVITPQTATQFLHHLDVRKIPGVGPVMSKKLGHLGIEYGAQLQEKSEQFLGEHFGKMGAYLYHIIRGHDPRPVVAHRERKSLSVETTFRQDLLYGQELLEELQQLTQDLRRRMEKYAPLCGKTLTVKIKFYDFQQITRSSTRPQGYQTVEEILAGAQDKLRLVCETEFPGKRIRLIGVGISKFASEDSQAQESRQLELFHSSSFFG
ncbi:DNA polymerase IV [candidate division KSB3 bacterium]|uniref:DNA polymerase IV n=1 Tax=candidate division KSB3 bacterium TaxID=2044937 RepID=A0A9D5JUS4_9BACT|nr:DNA polymerase IV [candidate division KSB3 bacterium]MBD3324499.1 DNA polymerase IV [candidate division KSB3 bacterium]